MASACNFFAAYEFILSSICAYLFKVIFLKACQQSALEAEQHTADCTDCSLQNLVRQLDISIMRRAVDERTA